MYLLLAIISIASIHFSSEIISFLTDDITVYICLFAIIPVGIPLIIGYLMFKNNIFNIFKIRHRINKEKITNTMLFNFIIMSIPFFHLGFSAWITSFITVEIPLHEKRIPGIILLILISPIAEEILFRGLAQNALRNLTSNKIAVIVISMIFFLLHAEKNLLRLLSSFGYGCSYLKTDNLYLNIINHIVWNALTVNSMFLNRNIYIPLIVISLIGHILLLINYKKLRKYSPIDSLPF